jgi:hypothetical protein
MLGIGLTTERVLQRTVASRSSSIQTRHHAEALKMGLNLILLNHSSSRPRRSFGPRLDSRSEPSFTI